MASSTVNRRGVSQARRLIAAGQYALDSDWGDVRPKADGQEFDAATS